MTQQDKIDDRLLTDEEIQAVKAEAERLSWTHKPHPIYEKEKYLLSAQLAKADAGHRQEKKEDKDG